MSGQCSVSSTVVTFYKLCQEHMNHRFLYLQNICLDYYTYQFPVRNVMGSKSVDARSILLYLNTDNSAEPKV